MKTKKIIIIGVVIFAGILVLAGFKHHRCRHGFSPEKIEDWINMRINRAVEELNLTEDQQIEFRKIRNSIKADFIKRRNRRIMLLDEIGVKLSTENPDMEGIVEFLKKEIDTKPSYFVTRMNYFSEFYNILDKEQKEIMIEKMRERIVRKQKRINRFGKALDRIDP